MRLLWRRCAPIMNDMYIECTLIQIECRVCHCVFFQAYKEYIIGCVSLDAFYVSVLYLYKCFFLISSESDSNSSEMLSFNQTLRTTT
jgi:hypothetical protein